jgi:hypothetical protein
MPFDLLSLYIDWGTAFYMPNRWVREGIQGEGKFTHTHAHSQRIETF